MSPIDYYKQLLQSGTIIEDARQLEVIEKLQKIYAALVLQKERKGILHKFKSPTPTKGLYLWGSVGSGKTFLIDIFYHCLPHTNKLRMHFHKFMQEVHNELTQLRGVKNPLQIIAKKFAKNIRVLCFDELVVTNIVDAMLLAELFKTLFAQGVCIIFTSNTAPNDLYKHGLQRQQFLPFIHLLKSHTETVHLESAHDYRLRYIDSGKFYWSPESEMGNANMEYQFSELSQHADPDYEPLQIHGRSIQIRKQADGVVWFDFMNICGIPRSQKDYLALVEKFHTILVSGVTAIAPEQVDLAQSFIKFIDVLYDAKIRLIISAAVPIPELYPEGRMSFEFKRARSRLVEMQSSDWTKAHRGNN